MQEKEYEEEVRKKKLKEQLEEKKYRNIAIRISQEENIFCLSIDGSQTSKDAFEINLTDFFHIFMILSWFVIIYTTILKTKNLIGNTKKLMY